MITTKTRVLSILATVAMLVSMLTCFVIPASALDAELIAAYTAVANDAASGGDAILEVLADSAATEDDLISAAALVTLNDNIKPRYAYKDAYANAYYAGSDYAISEPADWLKMMADAKAESGDYFSGLTFHLTNDIDFKSVGAITPMGNGTNSFAGTLDGHGYGFKNLVVACYGENDFKALSSDSVGLFYYLNGATIKDFGIYNGDINANTFGGGGCASAFGVAKGACNLTRVWCGANVRSTSSGHAAAFVGNSQDKGVVINGAYFYGIVGTNSKVSFTVAGAAYSEAARGNTYKNIISNATVSSNSNARVDNNGYLGVDTIPATHDFAMFRNMSGATLVENVYGITGTGKVQYSNAVIDGSITATTFAAHGATAEVGTLLKTDELEAAWTINNAPSATDPVYFTMKNGIIMPVAEATNAIIKVTVTGDVDKVAYINAGTIDLAADLGLYVGAGATYVVGEEPLGATVDAADDITIAATITEEGLVGAAKAELAPLVEKYNKYDPAVMADDTLKTFKDAVAAAEALADAEGELAALEAAIAAGKAVNLAIGAYPNLPAYKDYEIYKDINTGNNWLIKTADDWKAMMADVAAGSAANYFSGYTFHLVNDVDFASAGTLAPMGLAKYFGGTINGHGYGFSNLTIVANDIDTTSNSTDEYMADSYPGLFYRMGNCVLQDFGINSGSFKVTYGGAGTSITAFGYYKTKQPQLTRTWFGAEMTKGSGTNEISVLGHECQDSGAIFNGFYFYGTTNAGNSNIGGSNSRGNKFYNIIAAPTNVKAADYILRGFRGDLLINGNTNATVYDKVQNVYGIGYTNAYSYRDTSGITDEIKAEDNARLLASSALEAAWKINQNPSTSATPVYFTLKNGNIRPVADATNMIVKYSITGDVEEAGYRNAGEINLAEDMGIFTGEGATITLNGEPVTGETITVTDDFTMTVTYSDDLKAADALAAIAEEEAKYEGLNIDCFKTTVSEGKISLADWKAMVADAKGEEGSLVKLETAVDAIATIEAVTSDVPANMPQYKEYAKYSAFNTANNWLIKEAADWKAMIAKNINFAGYKFHLTADVEFNNEKMAPLGQGLNFAGEIYGHGFGFDNVYVSINNTDNKNSGLIAAVGAGCVIEDFGVNSGVIEVLGAGYDQVATFGDAQGAAELTKVWSGATLKATGKHGYGAGIVTAVNWSNVVVNGAYFYGTIEAGYCGDGCHGPADKFGIACENDKASYVYNVLAAPSADAAAFDGILKHNCSADARASINGVAVGFTQTIHSGHECTATANVGISYDTAASAGEGAWKLNNMTPASGVDAIYWAFNADGDIRPNGTADNQIVQVTLTGDVEAVKYFNKGTTLDLAADLEIALGEGTTVTIGGTEYTETTYALTDDVIINVEYSSEIEAREAVAVYDALDPELLVNGDFLTALRDALEAGEYDAVLAAVGEFTPELYGAENYDKLPAYSDYEAYAEYNTTNNWMIATAADWLAMVAASDFTGVSFEGYTFHLNADVDFNNVAMKPLCYGGAFRGNIDGHGYGFSNVLIDETTITSMATSVGLICKMTNGTVQNFGINSGAIDASEVDDNSYNYVGGLFGIVSCSVATDAINITRCWNGADVDTFGHNKQASGAALAGLVTSNENGTKNIIINGFLNTGDVTNHSTFSGELYTGVIASGSACHKLGGVFNSLNTGTITGVAAPDATVNPGKGATFMRLNLGQSCHAKNNASTGSLLFFHYGDPADLASVFTYSNGYASAEAAAYAVNKGNTGLTNAYSVAIDPVYYTITENGIRPTGTADNQIVKITIGGDKEGALYANKGTEASVEDIAAALGVSVSEITAINDTTPAPVAVLGDATITVTLDVCEHPNVTETWIPGTDTHKIECDDCEWETTGDCDGTWVAASVNMEDGTSKHTKTCSVCEHVYEEVCNGTLVDDATDCTKDSKYTFDCGIHDAEYVIAGSGNPGHTFEGAWTVEGDQEYRKCANCDQREYRAACTHPNVTETWIPGTNTHKIECDNAECDYETTGDCDGTWAAAEVDLTNGTSKHTKTCTVCEHVYEEDCNGVLVKDTTDCTKDSKYTFDCGIHEAEYVIADSGNENHTFSGDWVADGDKEYRKCENCECKEYRTVGKVEADTAPEATVKPNGAIDVTVTLGVDLTAADIILTPAAGYTVVGVAGEGVTWTEGSNTATVANAAANATIVVTLKADKLAVVADGELRVEITNASNAEGAVTDATITAGLAFEAVTGDANVDGNIDLLDALLTLSHTVRNPEDALQINTANANADDAAGITAADALAIVKMWLATL